MSIPEFNVNCPDLVDIYINAMGYDPTIRDTRIRVWRRSSLNPGFAAVCALLDSRLVGVTYGFLGSPDHWWQHQLRRGMRDEGGPTPSDIELLRNYFEVAEVHVQPGHQGQGIGRKLLKELLWLAPADNALLSTPEVAAEDNHAFHLYRSLGFTDVLRQFRFDGDQRPFAIMRAPLPINTP